MSNEEIFKNIDLIYKELKKLENNLQMAYKTDLKKPLSLLYIENKKTKFYVKLPNQQRFQSSKMNHKLDVIMGFIRLFIRFNNYFLGRDDGNENGKFTKWWKVENSKSNGREEKRNPRSFYSILSSPVSDSILKQ